LLIKPLHFNRLYHFPQGKKGENRMFKFNRKKFFDAYRSRFGALPQALVDAFEFLLAHIEADIRFGETSIDRRKIAYCLATFKWETAHTMEPIDERGNAAYFKKYEPGTTVGKVLGNTEEGDGARFHGRGYVQLTGRFNYTRAKTLTGQNLVANPDLAKNPELAYQIAIQGMTDGWFTGRKLSRYIKDSAPPDYEGAREIINRRDQAEKIASLARRFDEVLIAAIN
jgi:putative chitinase